jgi:hypothetical protein
MMVERMNRTSIPLPNLSKEPKDVRQRIEALEHIMEGLFDIPGTNRKVGLDTLLSLVPVLGSSAAAVIGAYLAWESRNLGMSKWQMARMASNIGVDWLLGLIPFIGVVPDYFFRSNTRNARIIKKHLDKHHPETGIIDVRPRG